MLTIKFYYWGTLFGGGFVPNHTTTSRQRVGQLFWPTRECSGC